jgi:hypothetical protein
MLRVKTSLAFSVVAELGLVRPMRRLLCSTLFLFALCLHADTPQLIRVDDAARLNLLLRYPKPEYAYEARRLRFAGYGVFVLRFDYATGVLQQVHIYNSTGHQESDVAVVAALKYWKAKPQSLHEVVVPITVTAPSPGP